MNHEVTFRILFDVNSVRLTQPIYNVYIRYTSYATDVKFGRKTHKNPIINIKRRIL